MVEKRLFESGMSSAGPRSFFVTVVSFKVIVSYAFPNPKRGTNSHQ